MSPPRIPLTRERVARTALAFVDEHGVDALSMRKLGAELGVEAMSLYNHVANKDDLLDALGDLLYGEVLEQYRSDPDGDWQDDARTMAHAFRRVAAAHERALPIMTDRILPSEVKIAFLDQVYRIFTRAGFPPKESAVVFDSLASWVIGAVRGEFGMMRELEERGAGIDRSALPPELHPVVDFAEACLAWTPDQRFEFGLDTVIAGIETQLARLS